MNSKLNESASRIDSSDPTQTVTKWESIIWLFFQYLAIYSNKNFPYSIKHWPT